MFDGHVDEGREARARRLRTLLDELVANVHPPADFVPSVHLQRDMRITHLVKRLRLRGDEDLPESNESYSALPQRAPHACR